MQCDKLLTQVQTGKFFYYYHQNFREISHQSSPENSEVWRVWINVFIFSICFCNGNVIYGFKNGSDRIQKYLFSKLC